MEKKLGKSQLDAWELFITRQSLVLGQIERSLDSQEAAVPLHWYDVLLVLKSAPEGKMRLAEIAERIVTSRSALTRSIDKIEAAGLIRKVKAKEDGRGLYAVITESGRKAQKETWVYYQQAIQEYFGKFFTEREADQLASLLANIPRKI